MKKFFLFLLGVVVLLAVVGVFLPRDYELSHSVVINAPAAKIHTLVGDLKKWGEWAPWKEEDPSIKVTYGDKTSGVGASQSWVNDKGEDGKLVITSSDPAQGVEYDMEMNEGQMTSTAAMRYTPEGSGTKVTWEMKGDVPMPVIGGYFALLMDSMVAPMFEKGLANLKAKAEAP